MSELIAPTEDNLWEFPRVSPVVEVEICGRELSLHYGNTLLYTFAGHWAVMNHVYIHEQDPELPSIYSFDCGETLTHLQELNFPHMALPFPSNTDLGAYSRYAADKFQQELDEM